MNTQDKTIYTYQEVAKDQEGYLKRSKDWTVTLAKEIANRENIHLNADHWAIIMFIRNFYYKFNITPSMRMLISSIKAEIGASKSNSIYLFTLFPKGPAEQASKIAGIPKPVRCL